MNPIVELVSPVLSEFEGGEGTWLVLHPVLPQVPLTLRLTEIILEQLGSIKVLGHLSARLKFDNTCQRRLADLQRCKLG
jgi:hypothetical protein